MAIVHYLLALWCRGGAMAIQRVGNLNAYPIFITHTVSMPSIPSFKMVCFVVRCFPCCAETFGIRNKHLLRLERKWGYLV